MARVRALVLRAAGTNCDLETVHAWQLAGAEVERVHLRRVAETPALLDEVQIVTIPGGFSFGDDIAAGRVYAAQVERYLRDALLRLVDRGGAILGICNGFQILVKAGILPRCERGRRVCTITCNEPPGFQDRWVTLAAESDQCIFLTRGQRYEMPIAHGEGRVVLATGARLGRTTLTSPTHQSKAVFSGKPARLATQFGGVEKVSAQLPVCEADQTRTRTQRIGEAGAAQSDACLVLAHEGCGPAVVALRYVPSEASPLSAAPINPNGSEADIAGLCDETGRVLGLMPHPERFVTWTQHPCWTSRPPREPGDGLAFFTNAVRHFA